MQKGKYKQLTNIEREEISRCLANKQPLAEIARQLGRAISTISREIYRNRRNIGTDPNRVSYGYGNENIT